MHLDKIKNRFLFVWIAGIFTFIQIQSCYSPVEGCLDPEATNYSISGDNACEDCCTYPVLDLSIFHENMDSTVRLGDTLENDLGQKVSLIDFVYLLSDFKVYIENDVYYGLDSVSLNVSTGTELGKDDIIRVSRGTFTYEIATMIFDGTTDSLSFRIGLSDQLNENRFTAEIDNHPLTSDPDSLYQSETDTYIFQRIQLAQGVDFLDTVVYDVSTSYETTFTIQTESLRGQDKSLEIAAQYNKWFDGIDFESMNKTEIEQKIGENCILVFAAKE